MNIKDKLKNINKEKIYINCKENKILHYIFIIIIGLAVTLPIFGTSIMGTNDGTLHVLRVMRNSRRIGNRGTEHTNSN